MANTGKPRSTNDSTRRSAVSKFLGKPTRTQRPSASEKGRDNPGFMPGIGLKEEELLESVGASVDDNRRHLGSGYSTSKYRDRRYGSGCPDGGSVVEDKRHLTKCKELRYPANASRIPEDGSYSGPGRPLVTGIRRRSDFMPGIPIVKYGSATALETLACGMPEAPIYEELDLKCASTRDLNSDPDRRSLVSPELCSYSSAHQPFSKHSLSFSSRYLAHRGLYSKPSCGIRIAELRASRKQEGLRSSPSSVSSYSSSSTSQSCSEAGTNERVQSVCAYHLPPTLSPDSTEAFVNRNHRSSLDLNVTYVEHFDEMSSKGYSSPQSSSPASDCPLRSSGPSWNPSSSSLAQSPTRASTLSASTQTTLTTFHHRQNPPGVRLTVTGPSPVIRRRRNMATLTPPSTAQNDHQQAEKRLSGRGSSQSDTPEPSNANGRLFGQERGRLSVAVTGASAIRRSLSEPAGSPLDCDASLASSQNSTDTLTDSALSNADFAENIADDELIASYSIASDSHQSPPSVETHSNAAADDRVSGVSRQTMQSKGPPCIASSSHLLPRNQRPQQRPETLRHSTDSLKLDAGSGSKCSVPSTSCPIQRSSNSVLTRKPVVMSNNSALRSNIQRIENFGQSVDSRPKSNICRLSKSSSSSDLPINCVQSQDAPGAQSHRPPPAGASNRSSETGARKALPGRQSIPVAAGRIKTSVRLSSSSRLPRSDASGTTGTTTAAALNPTNPGPNGGSPSTPSNACRNPSPGSRRDVVVDRQGSVRELETSSCPSSSSAFASDGRGTRLHPGHGRSGIEGNRLLQPSTAMMGVSGRTPEFQLRTTLQHQLSPIAEKSPIRRTFPGASDDRTRCSGGPDGPTSSAKTEDSTRVLPGKTPAAVAMVPSFRRLSGSQRATSQPKIAPDRSNSQVTRTALNVSNDQRRELYRHLSEDNSSEANEVSKSQTNIYEPTIVQLHRNNSTSCTALNAGRSFQKRGLCQHETRLITDTESSPGAQVRIKSQPLSPPTQSNAKKEISKNPLEQHSPVKSKEMRPVSDGSSRTPFPSRLKTPTEYNVRKRSDGKVGDSSCQRPAVESAVSETDTVSASGAVTSVFKHLQMRHVKPYSCASNKSLSAADKFTKTRISAEKDKGNVQSRAQPQDEMHFSSHHNTDDANPANPSVQQNRHQINNISKQQQQQQQFSETTAGQPFDDSIHRRSSSSPGNQNGFTEHNSPHHSRSHCAGSDYSSELTACSTIETQTTSPVDCHSPLDDGVDIKCSLPVQTGEGNWQSENEGPGMVLLTRQENSSVQSPKPPCASNFPVEVDCQRSEALSDGKGILEDDSLHPDEETLSGGEADVLDSSVATDHGRCVQVEFRDPLKHEERIRRMECRMSVSGNSVQDHESQTTLSDICLNANEAIVIKQASNRNSLVFVEPETSILSDIDKFVVTYESSNVIVLERADTISKAGEQRDDGFEMASTKMVDTSTSAAISSRLEENSESSRSTDVKVITSPKWEPGSSIPLSESGYDSWKSQSSKSSARFLKLPEAEVPSSAQNLGPKSIVICPASAGLPVASRRLHCLESRYDSEHSTAATLDSANGNGSDEKDKTQEVPCNPNCPRSDSVFTNNSDNETSMDSLNSRSSTVDEIQNLTDTSSFQDDLSDVLRDSSLSGRFSESVDSFSSSCSLITINSTALTRTNSDERFIRSEKSAGDGDVSPLLLPLSPADDLLFDNSESLSAMTHHSKDYYNQIYKLDFGMGDSSDLMNDHEELDLSSKQTPPPPLSTWLSAVNSSSEVTMPNNSDEGQLASFECTSISNEETLQQRKRASCELSESRGNQAVPLNSNTFPLTTKKTFTEVFTTKEARNFAETCQIFSRLNSLKQKTEKDTFYENVCDALLESLEPDVSDSDVTSSPTSPNFEKSTEQHKGCRDETDGKISQIKTPFDKPEPGLSVSQLEFHCSNGSQRTSSLTENNTRNSNHRTLDNCPAKHSAAFGQRQEEDFQTATDGAVCVHKTLEIDSVIPAKEPFSISQYCIDEQKLRLENSVSVAAEAAESLAKVSDSDSQNHLCKEFRNSSVTPDVDLSSSSKQEPFTSSAVTTPSVPGNEGTKSSSSILTKYFPALLRKTSKDRHSTQEVSSGSKSDKRLSLNRSTTHSSRNSVPVCHDQKFRNSNFEEPRSVKEVIKHFENKTVNLESNTSEKSRINETRSQTQDQKTDKKQKLMKKSKT